MMLQKLKSELRKLSNAKKATVLQRFFKTGKGEYGEGDIFLGISVPKQRKLAKKYLCLSLADLDKLIQSKIHEERLIALLILVSKFKQVNKSPFPNPSHQGRGTSNFSSPLRGEARRRCSQKDAFNFYLFHTTYINNWDLVDLSAPNIVGAYLADKNKAILYKLSRSKNLWERRIAILSTFDYIKKGESNDALRIAKILINDNHDLIHKAVGWMLREVGKKCGEKILTKFLDRHHKQMPRTMLRYAIERFPKTKRKKYLNML